MSLWDIGCVDAEGDVALLEMACGWNLIWPIQLIEHLYTSIFHDLLRAQRSESEFKEVWLIRYSLDHILTLVIIVERLRTECVSAYNKQ